VFFIAGSTTGVLAGAKVRLRTPDLAVSCTWLGQAPWVLSPSLDEAKAGKVTGAENFFCDRLPALPESGNAYTRCCFQRPRLNNTIADRASVENATGTAMNTPVGPKPR
jgi:hypothetical protein